MNDYGRFIDYVKSQKEVVTTASLKEIATSLSITTTDVERYMEFLCQECDFEYCFFTDGEQEMVEFQLND